LIGLLYSISLCAVTSRFTSRRSTMAPNNSMQRTVSCAARR